MATALIGYTGFVGGTLLRQRPFEATFRSTTIAQLPQQSYETIVCAGAPGRKWWANQQPQEDRAAIDALIAALGQVSAKMVVLISTVDVYDEPRHVDEGNAASATTPYGRHRFHLEQFVQDRFAQSLVVRLPGLVGEGLKKNAVYDFAHGREVTTLFANDEFQFYPVHRLSDDIDIALQAKLRLVHLVAEPVPLGELAREAFRQPMAARIKGRPVRYDVRSQHASLWSSATRYQVDKSEVVKSVKAYAQNAQQEAP